MRFIRLAAIIGAVFAGLSGGLLLAAPDSLVDRLSPSFLNIHASLPFQVNLYAFLILLAASSIAAAAAVILWCLGAVGALQARAAVASKPKPAFELSAQSAADQAAGPDPDLIRRLKDTETRCKEEFESLDRLSLRFREKLDKRHLVQAIVESAQRLTSTRGVESAVSLWLLDFGNDTFSLERGIYCGKESFAEPSFTVDAWPFSEVAETKTLAALESPDRKTEFLKKGKSESLGSATGLLVVPLVIEDSVLGVLAIFCDPEILKNQKEREGYYAVAWNHLAMALAIAVQGELAMTDRLTGVHNRAYFLRRFNEELDRANRYNLSMTLMMIDIDDFKPVNDTLGHLQGDAVLKIVAKLIRKSLRVIDLAARYGGEEFILLLPETGLKKGEEADPAASGVGVVAERVRSAIENEFEGLQKPLSITISIGVVVRHMPEDRKIDAREMIRLADAELYRAKGAGKNRVCYHSRKTSAAAGGAPSGG